MYAALSRGQANYILLTEPLHGCMFTLYWVGSVEYTKTITTTRKRLRQTSYNRCLRPEKILRNNKCSVCTKTK